MIFEAPTNSVCLDASALVKTCYSLKKKFSLIELLDLCSIAEQLVLRDAVILTQSVYRIPGPMKEPINPWLNSDGILIEAKEPRPFIVPLAPSTPMFSNHPDIADQTKITEEDGYRESGRLIGMQESFKRPAMPLIRNFKPYDRLVNPYLTQLAFDHVSMYSDDVKEMHAMIKELNKNIPNYVHIHFPPIALNILRESKSFDDIIKISLQYRVAYENFRNEMRELEELIRDPATAPFKKMQEKQKWITAWNKKNQEYKDQFMVLADGCVGVLSSGSDVLGNSATGNYLGSAVSGANFVNNLGKLVKKVYRNKEDRALIPIRDTFKDCLKTSYSEIREIVENLFEYDPCKFDDLTNIAFSPGEGSLENLIDYQMRLRVSKDYGTAFRNSPSQLTRTNSRNKVQYKMIKQKKERFPLGKRSSYLTKDLSHFLGRMLCGHLKAF